VISYRLNNQLIARALKGEAVPRRYRDGKNGLALLVRQSGRASWVLRYMHQGRRHDLGLGSLEHVGLSQARERAAEVMGELKGKRIDPLAERTTQRNQQRLANVTFDQAAKAFIASHRSGWRDRRGEETWTNSLETYASPVIGNKRVGEVDTEAVLKILQPIWGSRTETAARIRGRLERVLDYATSKGWRPEGIANPARWRGHLANLLPAKGKIARAEHHAALPLDQLPATFAKLWAVKRPAAQAVCFALLTAARASEASGALWSEINFSTKTWITSRTKQGQEQRYPLSPSALELLRERQAVRQRNEERVFATRGKNGPSPSNMLDALRKASGDRAATLHGSARSGLDDWVHEKTSYAPKLVDRQLGHAPGNLTVQAYRRADLLEQRRPMLDDWAKFLGV
jgi:integrase